MGTKRVLERLHKVAKRNKGDKGDCRVAHCPTAPETKGVMERESVFKHEEAWRLGINLKTNTNISIFSMQQTKMMKKDQKKHVNTKDSKPKKVTADDWSLDKKGYHSLSNEIFVILGYYETIHFLCASQTVQKFITHQQLIPNSTQFGAMNTKIKRT